MVREIDQLHIVFFTQTPSWNLWHAIYIHKSLFGMLVLQPLKKWKDGQVYSLSFCFPWKCVHFIKSVQVSFSAISWHNCAWSSCFGLCIMWIWNIIHKMSRKSFWYYYYFCFIFEIDIKDLFPSSNKKVKRQVTTTKYCQAMWKYERRVTEIKFTVLIFEIQEKETKVR